MKSYTTYNIHYIYYKSSWDEMHMLVSRWHFVKKVLCIDNSMSPWNGGSIRHFPHGDSQRGVVAPLPVRFLWTSAVNLARLWRAFVEKDFTHLADVCQTVLFFTDVLVTSLCPVILENSYIPAQWSVVTYKLLVHICCSASKSIADDYLVLTQIIPREYNVHFLYQVCSSF